MNGNELEMQVKSILRRYTWEVSPALYYTDPITKKAREKDIIATSLQFSNNEIINYYARLFIECKNFPKPTEIYEHANAGEVENATLYFNIPFANFSEMERCKDSHFYKYNEIVEPKDSEDFLYPAINQNLQSFSAFRKSTNEKGIYFLIVVYDGELFYIDQDGNRKKCDNALVKIETLDDTFNLPDKKCFIELVSIQQFENLFEKIRNDIQKVNDSLQFYYRIEQNRIEEKRRRIRRNDAR